MEIVNLDSHIITKLKTDLENVTVLNQFPSSKPKLPCVIIYEVDNGVYGGTIDSDGANHSNIGISVEVFTDGANRLTTCRKLASQVNEIIEQTFGMYRVSGTIVPNYNDETIARYVFRYNGVIDKNLTIYRG